jgi:hypothetical protein
LDDWAKICHLFSTGKHSKREISRIVGVSRGTVERALESDRAPRYDRLPTGSTFDTYKAKVRALLAVTPTMPVGIASSFGPGFAFCFGSTWFAT